MEPSTRSEAPGTGPAAEGTREEEPAGADEDGPRDSGTKRQAEASLEGKQGAKQRKVSQREVAEHSATAPSRAGASTGQKQRSTPDGTAKQDAVEWFLAEKERRGKAPTAQEVTTWLNHKYSSLSNWKMASKKTVQKWLKAENQEAIMAMAGSDLLKAKSRRSPVQQLNQALNEKLKDISSQGITITDEQIVTLAESVAKEMDYTLDYPECQAKHEAVEFEKKEDAANRNANTDDQWTKAPRSVVVRVSEKVSVRFGTNWLRNFKRMFGWKKRTSR